jgi:hypothetical protein
VLPTTNEGEANQMVHEMLEKAASLPLGDWFVYRIGRAVKDLEAAPYGGARYPVEARMDARIFARFHFDVGIGDTVLKPLETVIGRGWLQFAGIAAPLLRTIPREQQFADKLRVYTLPRRTPNSRVKDLIDLLLLMQSGKLEKKRIAEAVQVTFDHRRSRALPPVLPAPPVRWRNQFRELATECRIAEDMEEAFAKVEGFFESIASRWQT